MDNINIDITQLQNLYAYAVANGTEEAYAVLALQWAMQANAELELYAKDKSNWVAAYKSAMGALARKCACETTLEDDSDEDFTSWCLAHADIRNELEGHRRWRELVFLAHPNIDMDIAMLGETE